ncbi:phenylalanyl-tRNA synthetase beta subunit [Abditibacterium utsteinense]|uniref:Phenylalanine--tRNA ligase beta subunit n=1 Tax=Abditibacterium utsteinense TaxID=1960156 RepID=A0A2S8SQG3_9BACT|nr:phenylalanine--tRNA ligase subunit beta [Abditibacterium utsteinense]PQV62989.1 phenylalanyl-tRNA synthetase beta subunit [Abditibacterium utsteinense]
MRISAEWLGEFVALPPLEKLEETLLMAGLGIESREGERLELEVTSNRGDWLCATGIAREIAAMNEARFRAPFPDVEESGPSLVGRALVDVESSADCPRYVARLVEGVQIGESPDWMQKRLLDCGVRPINNVVDVTNYVMLEWGQPLHAFDFDKIAGKMTVRRARDSEKLVTLDGVERELSPEILAICDESGPIAVAGLMGGENSEVSDATHNVLLESAHFAPLRVRRNAHLLGLASEASKRFERWVDPNGCKRSIDRAAQLLLQIAGGKVAADVLDIYPSHIPDAIVTLRPARCNAVLGLKIPLETQKNLLVRLGFKVSESENGLRVIVPTHRRDIEREIDLIEEIARLYGYDRVPTTLHAGTNTSAGRPLASRLEDRARSAGLRCGLTELSSYSLSNAESHARAGVSSQGAVTLRNPLSEDYTLLRTSLVPSLLDALRRNRGRRLRGFELGRVYFTKNEGELADEKRMLGIALCDAPPAPHWQQSGELIDFFALKAIVENVLREFGAPAPVLSRASAPSFHPGRCAALSLNGEELGILGEIHPRVAESFELSHRAYVAQIDFDALVRHISLVRQYTPFSKFPSIERDIALLCPRGVAASALVDAAWRAGGNLLESARIFDVYQGENVSAEQKSVALALRFRALDRTLSESEVEGAIAGILENEARLGAVLRA